MNHRTNRVDRPPESDGRAPFRLEAEAEMEGALGSQQPDVVGQGDRRYTRSTHDIMHEVNCLVEMMNRDPQIVRQVAQFESTALVLSATDTGRELMLVLDGQGVRARPYAGEPFDVKVQATEEVHWAVLCGQMDADAAFFAGRIRISGSIVAAFRVKNKFLSLVQWHLAHTQTGTDTSALNH